MPSQAWAVLLAQDYACGMCHGPFEDGQFIHVDQLAMVAMARHVLLLSGRPQLDQAIALDPDVVLVSEAVRLLDGGWNSALAAYDQQVRRAALVRQPHLGA